MSNVPFRPPSYHSVTPHLALRGPKAALDFYGRAFGAELMLKLDMLNGAIAHAEIRIGDSILMLSEEKPDWGNRSTLALGGSPVHLMIYVPDADAVFARATKAGEAPVRPVEDLFYSDRSGTLRDSYGHQWTLATHIEDVSAEEAQRRMAAMFAK